MCVHPSCASLLLSTTDHSEFEIETLSLQGLPKHGIVPRPPYRICARPRKSTNDRSPVEGTGMPELPEVETVKRGLPPTMEGGVMAGAELRGPDLRFPFPNAFAASLEGKRIEALSRRAKYLLI